MKQENLPAGKEISRGPKLKYHLMVDLSVHLALV